jgi:hypothetical protein
MRLISALIVAAGLSFVSGANAKCRAEDGSFDFVGAHRITAKQCFADIHKAIIEGGTAGVALATRLSKALP